MPISHPDIALVFEGGGMRAAFSAGLLNALLEAGIVTGWVGGISAGSSCTANYLVQDQLRSRKSFVDLAAEKDFGNFGTWVRGKGMFHSDFIYQNTSGPGQILEYSMERLFASEQQFRIGGYACESGEMVYWGRDDMRTLDDLVLRVRASSTMPLVMPWTTVGGTVYADGALGPTGGFAHDAARADGYSRFIVVTTRERGYRKADMKNKRAMAAALRRYPEVFRGLEQRPANYNRSLDELTALEEAGNAFLIFPESMPIKNGERSVPKLRAVYEAGLEQGRREIPRLREWCIP